MPLRLDLVYTAAEDAEGIRKRALETELLAYRKNLILRKGFGERRGTQPESAEGALPTRGKQRVSRLFSRWNASVYSSAAASRNSDFDLGVDFVDTGKALETEHGFRRFSLLHRYAMIDGGADDQKKGMKEDETLGFAAHGN